MPAEDSVANRQFYSGSAAKTLIYLQVHSAASEGPGRTAYGRGRSRDTPVQRGVDRPRETTTAVRVLCDTGWRLAGTPRADQINEPGNRRGHQDQLKRAK